MPKTTKKAPKKKSKVTSTSSSSPLLAATSTLDKALQNEEWRTDLDPETVNRSLPHIPFGSLVIDYLIGGKPNSFGVPPCPGMPRGRIMQLYGHEGSGKSTAALTCAAETCANGGTVCYIDWENEIVPYYAKKLGVPIEDGEKFLLCQPTTLEEGCVIAYTMAKHGVDLIVFDSVGAGVPKRFLEGKVEDIAEIGQVGLVARIWSTWLPRVKGVIQRTGTSIIGISQLREGINTMGYGPSDTQQGGKAWKFYSCLRMRLQRIKTEHAELVDPLSNKKQKKVTGAAIKVKLDKCKVSAQQGNEEIMYIRHGEGIDDYRTIMEVSIAHNIIKKSGSWYEWTHPETGELTKGQGMDSFRHKLSASGTQNWEALYGQILPMLGASSSPLEEEEGDQDQEPPVVSPEELEDLLDMAKK